MNETPDFWANFLANLKIATRRFSSYIGIAAAGVIEGLSRLAPADLAAKMGAFDFLAPLVPYAGVITFLLVGLAQAWPQRSVTIAVLDQAAKNADVTIVNDAATPGR